jgi:hypothetical protein
VEIPVIDLSPASLESVERELLKHPQLHCGIVHKFSPGIYLREMTAPAGALLVGHHHKDACMNILAKGTISLLHKDGSVQTVTAPYTFCGEPGRKIALTHTEVVWMNVFATNETNVAVLEEKLFDKSSVWKANEAERIAFETASRERDREDYRLYASECGMTDVADDEWGKVADLPSGEWRIAIGKSSIHGTGLFATSTILSGEWIGPAYLRGHHTIISRYANHSVSPNAELVIRGRELGLVAIKDIRGCYGGFCGDEITVNYRNSTTDNIRRLT